MSNKYVVPLEDGIDVRWKSAVCAVLKGRGNLSWLNWAKQWAVPHLYPGDQNFSDRELFAKMADTRREYKREMADLCSKLESGEIDVDAFDLISAGLEEGKKTILRELGATESEVEDSGDAGDEEKDDDSDEDDEKEKEDEESVVEVQGAAKPAAPSPKKGKGNKMGDDWIVAEAGWRPPAGITVRVHP